MNKYKDYIWFNIFFSFYYMPHLTWFMMHINSFRKTWHYHNFISAVVNFPRAPSSWGGGSYSELKGSLHKSNAINYREWMFNVFPISYSRDPNNGAETIIHFLGMCVPGRCLLPPPPLFLCPLATERNAHMHQILCPKHSGTGAYSWGQGEVLSHLK